MSVYFLLLKWIKVKALVCIDVPGRGLEPPKIALSVPKTDASTNFATRA